MPSKRLANLGIWLVRGAVDAVGAVDAEDAVGAVGAETRNIFKRALIGGFCPRMRKKRNFRAGKYGKRRFTGRIFVDTSRKLNRNTCSTRCKRICRFHPRLRTYPEILFFAHFRILKYETRGASEKLGRRRSRLEFACAARERSSCTIP